LLVDANHETKEQILLTFLATKEPKDKTFLICCFFLPMLAKVFLEQDLGGLDEEHQHVFIL
jgi:hypothetical protein